MTNSQNLVKIQELAVAVANRGQMETKRELTELFVLIMPMLRIFINQYCKNENDTDDILGNTMEKLVSHIDTYNPQYKFTTWAYRIAKNESMQFFNVFKKNKISTEYIELRDDLYSDNEDSFITDKFEAKRDQSSLYLMIVDMINLLPDSLMKSVFYDCKVNHMKGPEVAEKYGVSPNTIKSYIREGTYALKNMVFDVHPELKDVVIV